MTILISNSFRTRHTADDAVMAHPTGGAIVSLEGLGRSFNGRAALAPMSFTIAAGEIFAVVGAPGAGRSTLLALLAGRLAPSQGAACVAGYALPGEDLAVRGAVGLVPTDEAFDPVMSGRGNLMLAARRLALTPAQRDAQVRGTLDDLGLTADADRAVGDYDAGQRRRLEFARAALHRPQVLFLDEPTRGLGRDARHLVWKHLLDLRALHGTTLVFTTGRAAEAETHADRMAVLRRGELVAIGTWETVSEAALDEVAGVPGGLLAVNDSEPRLKAIRALG